MAKHSCGLEIPSLNANSLPKQRESAGGPGDSRGPFHVACVPAVASSQSIASSGPKDRYGPVNPVRQAQGSKSFNNNLDL